MKEQKKDSKSVLAVSLSLVFVLILVIALFITSQSKYSNNGIQLPETHSEAIDQSALQGTAGEELLLVDNKNVIDVLSSLPFPENYHQTYTVEVGSGANASTSTVEIWVSGTYKHAEISTPRTTKTILTDGVSLWVWYSSDLIVSQFKLGADVTFEDALGIPAFDYLQTLGNAEITEAEYLMRESKANETSCIFLSAQIDETFDLRYWINLETGLLFEADAMEENAQTYRVEQNACDLLAEEDEAFIDRFTLPDGTSIIG